jgi:hypothetical protein
MTGKNSKADDGGEIKNGTLYGLSECAIGQAESAAEDDAYQSAAMYVRRARDDLDALAEKLEARTDEQEG